MEELTSICKRLRVAGRRPRPFIINGKKAEQGADLIFLSIPTGRSIVPEKDVPSWNVFPAFENHPRLLLSLAGRILEDSGYILIFHSGSLQSSQQIADCLDAMADSWKHFISYNIMNESPTYIPNSKLSQLYSRVEVIVREAAIPKLPKQEYWAFDKNNTEKYLTQHGRLRSKEPGTIIYNLQPSPVYRSTWKQKRHAKQHLVHQVLMSLTGTA
ncbi:hypothetical protein R1sor_009062 [Riccia sorocarpa]|uniref:Ribosomal protein S2 n=1 Tax=Riccia sorocarpa TaxID=122646 RepID=A0ABD3H4X7_9MARC